MTPCTHTSKCKAFAYQARTRIHAPGTAAASTGEYLAGQQHRHGQLAAASSGSEKTTPWQGLGVGAKQRPAQSGSSSAGLGSWGEFSRPSTPEWYHERRAVTNVSQDPSPEPHCVSFFHSQPSTCSEFLFFFKSKTWTKAPERWGERIHDPSPAVLEPFCAGRCQAPTPYLGSWQNKLHIGYLSNRVRGSGRQPAMSLLLPGQVFPRTCYCCNTQTHIPAPGAGMPVCLCMVFEGLTLASVCAGCNCGTPCAPAQSA